MSNAALAVGADIDYVRVRVGDEVLIVAAALAERVLGEGKYAVESTLTGADLAGTAYDAPVRRGSATTASAGTPCSRPTS